MRGSKFVISGAVRAEIERLLKAGEDPWHLFAGQLSSVSSLDAVPKDSTLLSLSGQVSDLQGLHTFNSLYALHLGYRRLQIPDLEIISTLTSLRILLIDGVGCTALTPLARLRDLQFLGCTMAAPVRDLRAVGALYNLHRLILSGDRYEPMKVETLAPLSSLSALRHLHLSNVRVRDGSLAPLAALKRLRALQVPNWFRTEEFAELAVALPETEGPFRSPFFLDAEAVPHPQGDCGSCRSYRRAVTIGKPWKRLCPTCDAARVKKHIDRWESLLTRTSSGG